MVRRRSLPKPTSPSTLCPVCPSLFPISPDQPDPPASRFPLRAARPRRSPGGGRWMSNPSSTELSIEYLNIKDQYETPAHIWRHAVGTYKLSHDAHASSLKYRVLPRHQQEVDGETFRCMEVADERFASCEAPCPVWLPAPNSCPN